MTARVVDVETTGTDPAKDRIVEIASIDLNRDGTFTNARSRRCFPGMPVPPEASAVHHITDADVVGLSPFTEIANEFAGADLYIAHNAAFERGFLDTALGSPRWICTMKCARRVWPEAPGFSNQVLRYWLGLVDPFGVPRHEIIPHSAASDVIVTGAIFIEMSHHASFAEMVQWTSEPVLYASFPFGKHRGVPLGDVPADYLEWVIGKSDLDADAKYSARHWLEKRKVRA